MIRGTASRDWDEYHLLKTISHAMENPGLETEENKEIGLTKEVAQMITKATRQAIAKTTTVHYLKIKQGEFPISRIATAMFPQLKPNEPFWLKWARISEYSILDALIGTEHVQKIESEEKENARQMAKSRPCIKLNTKGTIFNCPKTLDILQLSNERVILIQKEGEPDNMTCFILEDPKTDSRQLRLELNMHNTYCRKLAKTIAKEMWTNFRPNKAPNQTYFSISQFDKCNNTRCCKDMNSQGITKDEVKEIQELTSGPIYKV